MKDDRTLRDTSAGSSGGFSPVKAPAPALAKGGGAIRGLGETFRVNPATGTCSFGLPLGLTPGRQGLGPSLSLSYDSGAGNGPVGVGWQLEAETFTTSTAYDALNRPVSITKPDQSEIRPIYNEAGLLEAVDVRIRGAAEWTPFVTDIDYNEKGQRQTITYGNGVVTAYTYDPLTFRLSRLKTTRPSDSAVLQDLRYTFDLVGNIVEIEDKAQQGELFGSPPVPGGGRYVYDAIYRLIQAEGREHPGQQPTHEEIPRHGIPHPNDVEALRSYTELYQYDDVGNILAMIHQAGSATVWRRGYQVAEDSDRLLGTSLPGDQEGEYSATYTHDEHGNMTSMPNLASIGWNFKDQQREVDLGGGGKVYYVYNSAGERVRKVWEHSGIIEERIYLGGYEVYRRREGLQAELVLERETLHVMDDTQRIALVETKTVDTSVPPFTPTPRVRYQLSNHLGSAILELDHAGLVISYEEYHPYGTTAYHAVRSGVEVSAKRYRYTGKECDEETGLYYHGARHYAPWLGRWTSADPIGLRGGVNLYAYVTANPIRLHDPSGMLDDEPNYGLEALQHISTVNSAQLGLAPASREEVKAQGADAAKAAKKAAKVLGTAEVSQADAPEPEATDPDPLYRATGIPSFKPPPEGTGATTETFPEYPGYSYSYTEPDTAPAEIVGTVTLAFGPGLVARLGRIGSGGFVSIAERTPVAEGSPTAQGEALPAAAKPGAGPAVPPGTPDAAKRGPQVLLDSNVTTGLKADPMLSGRILPGEQPMLSYVSIPEMRNVVLQGGSLRGVPRAAYDLPTLSAKPSIDLRINIRGMLPDRPGRFGDGVIGAQSVEGGIPLLTNDKALRDAVRALGGQVR